MTKIVGTDSKADLPLTSDAFSLRTAAWVAIATGAAAITSVATPAQAGYSVQTNANTGGSYNRGCAATYNYFGPSSGANFVVNDGSNASCPPPATSFNNQLITIGGSLDTTGRLTAANDMSTVQAINGSYGAVATAAADLATGQVHLAASAFGDLGGAVASARLNDTLHFTVAGADANTITYIPVSFAFDGQLDGPSNPSTASAELNYTFSFGGAYAYEFGDYGAGYYGIYGNYPVFAYAGAPRVGGWASSSFTSYDPLDTKFAGVYAIMGSAADIPIDFYLGINAARVSVDFSHTGSVNIGHVDGVSFTSDSGTFLSANNGAVPEPASWATIVVGIGFVGGVSRRRKRATRAVFA